MAEPLIILDKVRREFPAGEGTLVAIALPLDPQLG